MDDVDIIIPVFNAANTIVDTINSALLQSCLPNEVIVVDDGSTDDSVNRVRIFGERVRVISKTNGGQGSARAKGAQEANAEYVLFLDSDDVLFPDAIHRLKRLLMAVPDAVLAYGRAAVEGSTNEDLPSDLQAVPDVVEGAAWEHLVKSNFIRTPGCVLIRQIALVSSGGWDSSPSLQGNEDWDLWLRLSDIGPFAYLDEDVLRYRVHGTNFSANRRAMRRSYVQTLRKHTTWYRTDKRRSQIVRDTYRDTRRQLSAQLIRNVEVALETSDWGSAWAAFSEAIELYPPVVFRSVKSCLKCLRNLV